MPSATQMWGTGGIVSQSIAAREACTSPALRSTPVDSPSSIRSSERPANNAESGVVLFCSQGFSNHRDDVDGRPWLCDLCASVASMRGACSVTSAGSGKSSRLARKLLYFLFLVCIWMSSRVLWLGVFRQGSSCRFSSFSLRFNWHLVGSISCVL